MDTFCFGVIVSPTLEIRVCETPSLSLVRIKSPSYEPKSSFMNSEQRDFLSAARMPPASLDVRENSEGGELNQMSSARTGFIDEKQLLARLPISRGTLVNWKAKGLLPYIKIGRRCLYDWASVQSALLRRQRGGQS
jgi:hypothetical protein